MYTVDTSDIGFQMEVHLDIHGCELVGHVTEHVWEGYLSAIVVVANSAVNFLINTKLRLVMAA